MPRYFASRPINHRWMPKHKPPVERPIEAADDLFMPMIVLGNDVAGFRELPAAGVARLVAGRSRVVEIALADFVVGNS